MKKLLIIASILCIGSAGTSVYAQIENFENLTNLNPEQSAQLAKIQENYKQRYNEIETNIMNYTDKLNRVKQDTDKTPEQLSILKEAYERNIDMLKKQKQLLEETTEAQYKTILNQEQYKQLKSEQSAVESSFEKFLRK